MKDFNIAKYLKENNLGPHGILGNYVDLQPLKEDKDEDDKGSFLPSPEEFQDYLDSLKEKEDYGNNKPVDEVPYVGADEKLDGFGDEFDQVDPVSEAEDEEENPWMEDVDATEAYKIGNWTCEYDHPGVLVWSYKNVPYSKLAVYATPNWENEGTTPIQIDIDEETQDNMTLKQSEFADFNEYATAMKPYLDRIEDLESNWGSLAEPENEEVTVSSSGVEMEEAVDGEDYSEEQGQFDTMMDLSHEYLGDPRVSKIIRTSIKNLRDHGFSDQDIVDFLATEF